MRDQFRRLSIVLLVLGLAACSQPAQNDDAATGVLSIDGRLADPSDVEVLLERAGTYVGFTFAEVATAHAEKGRFRFEVELAAPEILYLSVAGAPWKSPIFVGNEIISVKLASDADGAAIVEGSALDNQFRAFTAAYAPALAAALEAESAVEEALAADEVARHALAQTAFDEIETRRERVALEWLESNSGSTLGSFIGIRHLALTMDEHELEPLVATLDRGLRGTPYYDQLAERLETLKRVAVGAVAPDFVGTTPNQDKVALASMRGKVVLLDFWASWCLPCRKEHPELVTLYEEYRDSDFEILGIGLEFQEQRWLDAIAADELPWPNISELSGFDTQAAQLFAIRSIPANVLVGRDGKILAKDLHGKELRLLVASLL